MEFPRITVVTPNLNQGSYLEQALLSVLEQKYPNLEYIVVDGGSTDESLQVLERYRPRLARVISEPDEGLADALNKGFASSEGEIMAWINSDDILLPGSLYVMARLFKEFPYVNWITGRNSWLSEQGNLVDVRDARLMTRARYLCGDYRWIQQESTFWSRSLWQAAGASLSTDVSLACDLELWLRYFRHAHLYTVPIQIGAGRRRQGQLSGLHHQRYLQEADNLIANELRSMSRSDLNRYAAVLARASRVNDSAQDQVLQALLAAHDLKPLLYDDDRNIFFDPNLPSTRLMELGILAPIRVG